MVRPWDGAHGAPYPECVHGKLYHGREALAGNIYTAGKELPRRGLQADWDGEQQMNKVHRSIWVDLQQRHPFKTWDQVHPEGEVGQEGVPPTA